MEQAMITRKPPHSLPENSGEFIFVISGNNYLLHYLSEFFGNLICNSFGAHSRWPRAVACFTAIRAGVGAFCLLALTKLMFEPNISDTTTLPFLQPPKENTEIATAYDTMWRYFAHFAWKYATARGHLTGRSQATISSCVVLSKACLWKQCFFSVAFLAGHGEICPPHGWSTWRPADQTTTRRSTWISCMVFFKKAPSPCGSACCGLFCRSPCGSIVWGQISPWPARRVTDFWSLNTCLDSSPTSKIR